MPICITAVALREIRRFQKSNQDLIQRVPFTRLIREIAQTEIPNSKGYQWQRMALDAMQMATETFLVTLLESKCLKAIGYANGANPL
jgi:histone H3-like centromeric protein A